jgi:hypothetical protein
MRHAITRSLLLALALLALALPLGGCEAGGSDPLARDDDEPAETAPEPVLGPGPKGDEEEASQDLGFPVAATKNTTRVGGADSIASAAGVARAVYSARSVVTRPTAVTLVDAGSWQAGIAAAVLMSPPMRSPVLLTEDGDIPAATQEALDALRPRGARQGGRPQVIRVGDAPEPEGLRSVRIEGRNPYELARAIDRYQTEAAGKSSDRVVIASGERPEWALPAAGWAAKSGDPVLFTQRDRLPEATRAALRQHQQPRIYVLGPAAAVSDGVLDELRRLGTVRRIQGRTPVQNSIEFARYVDGSFGWGVVDPGHGLVFANLDRPLDAVAASPLSASGAYGPIVLLDRARALPGPVESYLLDIQPGFASDPVRGVYNHGWLIGDEPAISADVQSRIDALLEIVPIDE